VYEGADHLYGQRALSHALNKHAFRLLSMAGLRPGGCMGNTCMQKS
jgi:hypothetical protein